MTTPPHDPHQGRERAAAARASGRRAAVTRALVLALGISAAVPVLAAGDAATGKTLHEKDCVACHARRFGGDPAKIYTRADRKATTPAKLNAQIAVCNSELGTGYFPEEEEHLATYLELTYYKFK